MAGSQLSAGDGLPSRLAEMSKTDLYGIMSQMKTLIEQNQEQAREILIQNPLLTRTLFQAQIMLGMVQPPKAIPKIQPTASQPPPQSMQPPQHANIQTPQSLPKQSDLHEQTIVPQTSAPLRKQHQLPPGPPPSISAPPTNLPPPPLPSHTLQPSQNKNTANAQLSQMPLPQSSQVHNISHSLQPPMSVGPSQLPQPLPTSGIPHMMMQPPMPPQPRPPSMPNFPHHPQMGPNTGFQHLGAPQLHHSQPMFHPGMRPPSMGPSFPQGQPPRPSQPPPHPMYQVGGPHLNTEFGNQIGNSGQPERGGSAWMPGPPDNKMLPLPPPPVGPSSQMGQANQPPRPAAPLTPEMEQALLQQVMSLTQEQINLLPPEQRNQVLQLQQMLRQ